MKKIKHYFASANTGLQFYNLFSNINDDSKKGMLYIIKGGPGTGKSTLMKKLGEYFYNKGEEIEYFHCSSDPSSLDGVRLKNHNIAIVDGTAPHVTEATLPSIKEKIINVGENICESVGEHENKIRECIAKKAIHYKIAYSLIEAAAKLYECNWEIYKSLSLHDEVVKKAASVFQTLNATKVEGEGKIRKLFLTAIAGDGEVNYEKNNNYKNIIEIEHNDFVATKALEIVNTSLIQNGFNTTCFCNVLVPSNLESIYIDQLDIFIKTSKIQLPTENKEFDELVKANIKQIEILKKMVAKVLSLAKKQHLQIEKFYIAAMDFEAIDQTTKNLTVEIENRIKC